MTAGDRDGDSDLAVAGTQTFKLEFRVRVNC